MQQEQIHTRFSRTLLAGLFIGLIATVVSLMYNLIFRQITDFELPELINVSTIIFSVPFLLLIACFMYYALSRYKLGTVMYIILSAIVMLLCIVIDFHLHRSPDPILTADFRKLLLGIIVISGLSSFFIPYMATYENDII